MTKRYLHFVGIGGSGMSALAQILRAQGNTVSGSDRSFDKQPGLFGGMINTFKNQEILLHPQDGSAVNKTVSAVIVSTAIEESNPDIAAARKKNIPIITRAQLLSSLFNDKYGIAVGGTSGKSTVAAMIAFILYDNGFDPVYIGGGIIKGFPDDTVKISNSLSGKSDIICVETDESDGSIVLYRPKISVITNISKDHKEVAELKNLFSEFIKNTQETVIINNDCPILNKLDMAGKKVLTFGIENDADIQAKDIVITGKGSHGSQFSVNGVRFSLRMLGKHNISNALSAIAVCESLKIPIEMISSALSKFNGIKRRLELIGEKNGIRVYDDFSHNPAKIGAAISALRSHCKRLIVVFQPHGFGPTQFMKNDFIEVFSKELSDKDLLLMPDIFDAGGTANRSISSNDLVEEICANKIQARYIPRKEDIQNS